MTAETRERLPYKQRELAKAERYLATLERMTNAIERSEMPPSLKEKHSALVAETINSLTKLNEKFLSLLPDDFAPSAPRGGFEVGDEVSIKEEFREAYGTKKNEVFTVADKKSVGGAEDGRGSKVFLRLKAADGRLLPAQSSHCE